jgi:hypothetical protein
VAFVHWLIETGVFPETAARVTAALEAEGIPWTRYEDDMPATALPAAGVPVLFWGSLGAAYVERVAARWQPGAIGDPDRFRCSVYFPALRPLLANRDGLFTTVQELVDTAAEVLAPLGVPSRVFVRPDSALKPFAGRVLGTGELNLSALGHGFYHDDEHLPILVAPPLEVGREWRLVVGDGAVVAGSEYGPERSGQGADVPADIHALASIVARNPWQAAPLYVVDIAEVDGAPCVMELNPFSGADLYLCDPGAVVLAASAIASRVAGG